MSMWSVLFILVRSVYVFARVSGFARVSMLAGAYLCGEASSIMAIFKKLCLQLTRILLNVNLFTWMG